MCGSINYCTWFKFMVVPYDAKTVHSPQLILFSRYPIKFDYKPVLARDEIDL